jgi:hypothetical protein
VVDADALPPAFEREYGCSPAEWARWMRDAVTQGRPVEDSDTGSVAIALGAGRLEIHWRALPQRTIALIRLPRLGVAFRFEGVAASERAAFMRRLDLQLQRGGG